MTLCRKVLELLCVHHLLLFLNNNQAMPCDQLTITVFQQALSPDPPIGIYF